MCFQATEGCEFSCSVCKKAIHHVASRPEPATAPWSASAASFSFCFRVGLGWGLAWRAGQHQAARRQKPARVSHSATPNLLTPLAIRAWRHPPSSRPATRVSGPRARTRVSCKRRSGAAPRRLAQVLLRAIHRSDQCHAPQGTARGSTTVSWRVSIAVCPAA